MQVAQVGGKALRQATPQHRDAPRMERPVLDNDLAQPERSYFHHDAPPRTVLDLRTIAHPFVSERSFMKIRDTFLPCTISSKVAGPVDRWIVNRGSTNLSYLESAVALPTAQAWV